MRIRPSLASRSLRGHASPADALITAAVLATLAASVPAQRQFDELQRRGLPVDSAYTQAVAVGDVDGDGDLDLVFGNYGFPSPQNRLYLNDGTGTFTEAATGRIPRDNDFTKALALGDVDGDGDLDMVLGTYRYQNRLYLNNGTGNFTDATGQRLPADFDSTSAVALGDVDGDGDLDIVFGNGRASSGGQNRLYLNDGTGTFTDATAARMPAASDFTSSVAVGDVDGDGDLDIVFGNEGPGQPNPGYQNRLYLNDGTGTFTDATAARMPVDNDLSQAVALGDVDGDGDLDMVFGNRDTLGKQNRLYLNDGSGTFTDATAALMPADSDSSLAVVLGDVDGDGDLDMIFGNGGYSRGQQNRLYLNDGTGNFTDATAQRLPAGRHQTQAVVLDDGDGDGDLDLVFGNGDYRGGRQNRLYLNDGAGNYTDATAKPMPADRDETHSVALGDVDGDGDLDLVFGNGRYPFVQRNRLYLNDGSGNYTDATAARMPTDSDDSLAVALGDVDVDGDLDMIFGNAGGNRQNQQNRLYLNDGSGNFTDATPTRMPPDSDFSLAVALGDVDGDGDLDMVFGNSDSSPGQQNRIYLNDGTGNYMDATAQRLPAVRDVTRAVGLGDVDGDGDLDMVLGNLRQQNRLYLNDGTGTFADATAQRLPVDNDLTLAVALGDADGDGDLDMVFGNEGQNRLYLNDGAGNFTDSTAARMPADNDRSLAGALGDVDRDGNLDMVFGNGVLNLQNRLYLNDGSGNFTDSTAARIPALQDDTRAVVLGDVDGDGDLDMAFGNSEHQNRLYVNLLRQLQAPFLLKLGGSYQLEAYARYGPPSLMDVALPFLSTATASIPLPPLGTLGLDPTQMLPLPSFVIPQPAGVGSVSIAVPNHPTLVGLSIYAQALLVQNPFQARLTNVTADVILR